MSGFAWVTLATNDSYSLGALVLAQSLRRVGTAHQLAVLITPGVSPTMREQLASIFDTVQEVNVLDSNDESNLALLARPELGITFTKLHCWTLTQYSKCVFLDADTLVLQQCDELFDRDELSAAPDVGWPDCFNSGVFVYRPSLATFRSILDFALTRGSFDGGDQGLLNLYFCDWSTQDASRRLPFIYNMCSTACYSYLPAFKQFGSEAKIVHFIGAMKPWLLELDTQTGLVNASSHGEHLRGLLQQWWSLFLIEILPKLQPDMTGMAGALSQLSIGSPKSEAQTALEEHWRRQAWEHGHIDYLGKDAFDKIWAKILNTLTITEPPATSEAAAPSETPSGESAPPEPEAAALAPPSQHETPQTTPLTNVTEPLTVSPPAPLATLSGDGIITETAAQLPEQPADVQPGTPAVPSSIAELPSVLPSVPEPLEIPAVIAAEPIAVPSPIAELPPVLPSVPEPLEIPSVIAVDPIAVPCPIAELPPVLPSVPEPLEIPSLISAEPIAVPSPIAELPPVLPAVPEPFKISTVIAAEPIAVPSPIAKLPPVLPSVPEPLEIPSVIAAADPIAVPSPISELPPVLPSVPEPLEIPGVIAAEPIAVPSPIAELPPVLPSVPEPLEIPAVIAAEPIAVPSPIAELPPASPSAELPTASPYKPPSVPTSPVAEAPATISRPPRALRSPPLAPAQQVPGTPTVTDATPPTSPPIGPLSTPTSPPALAVGSVTPPETPPVGSSGNLRTTAAAASQSEAAEAPIPPKRRGGPNKGSKAAVQKGKK